MPAVTKAKRVVHQKAKGPVDPGPGQRVRALRQEHGLTQSDLAGPDFTKGYISLVETGRSRMSLRAAEIIAGRLGVTVAEILGPGEGAPYRELDLQLVMAESKLAAGQPAEALDIAGPLERSASGQMVARLRRLRGRALIELGRAREAVRVLDEALRSFRSGGDRELVARTLFDLARAHARLEEHGEALNLALQSEHMVNDRAVVDRTFELRLLSFLASALVTVGDFGAADLRAERAKAVAEDVADPRAVAALYENLAVTRQRQNDLEAALTYARRSLSAYEQLDSAAGIGSAWNSIGWVYIQRGQHGRAAEALSRAERLATANRDGRLMAYVLQSRAELALAKGDAQQAVRLAEESIEHPDASNRCRAISQLVRAKALAGTKATDAAVNAAFRATFDALEPQGRRMLANAYQAHFEALLERGRAKEANASARKALELLQPAL